MVDYYSTLLRAVTAPNAGDARWRRALYDRARQMLTTQLRARHPQSPMAAIAAEQAELEAAIERIESELSWTDRGTAAPEAATLARVSDDAADDWVAPQREPRRLGNASWLVLAVVAAALGAGGYVLWSGRVQKSAPAAVKSEATSKTPSEAPSKAAPPVRESNAAKIGDLAPGIDGGSSDPDQPYFFRRQTTFYRTLQPVGTVIVDKDQHLLYLIQPNSVALRYGIGLGESCADLAGLHHVADKAEWPQWQPSPDMIARRLAKPGVLPGAPGNPLGARVFHLDDGKSSIHGTNAPKTIGTSVAFGCIRLANDDIVDLYGRVAQGTSVIAQ